MSRISAGVGCVLVVVGLLAGCSASAEEPVGVTGAPTVGPTSAPTPSPTAIPTPTGPVTGVVLDLSDAQLGIVFQAAPAVEGDAADVFNWVATFEKESWRTMATRQLSPAFAVIAAPEVTAIEQWALDTNNKDASVFGGVLHVGVGGIVVNGDTATGTACRDFSGVTFSNADGPDTPEQAGFGQPRLMELSLARVSGEDRWKVVTLTENGTC